MAKLKMDIENVTLDEISETMKTWVHSVVRFVEHETRELWFTDNEQEAEELYAEISQRTGDTHLFSKAN